MQRISVLEELVKLADLGTSLSLPFVVCRIGCVAEQLGCCVDEEQRISVLEELVKLADLGTSLSLTFMVCRIGYVAEQLGSCVDEEQRISVLEELVKLADLGNKAFPHHLTLNISAVSGNCFLKGGQVITVQSLKLSFCYIFTR